MSEHEANLARLIAGELDPDSTEGREALEAMGLSSEDLEGLRDLASDLDAAAAEREDLARISAHVEDLPGVDEIASTLDRLAGEDGPVEDGAVEPSRGLPGWLLPAAAVLLLLPLVFQWLGPDGEPEQVLGDHGVKVTLDEGAGGTYGAVSYMVHDPQPGDEVVLLLYDGEDATRVTALREYPLDGSPWSNPAEQKDWPDTVHLRVEVRRAGFDDHPHGFVEGSRD